MLVIVELLAFPTRGLFRLVAIPLPVEEAKKRPLLEVLETVFKYGQNDIQPRVGCCSVSTGDVIELCIDKKELYVITSCGFKQLTEQELKDYEKLPVRDRYWKYADSENCVK